MRQRKCEGIMLVVRSWKFECQARLQSKPLRHDNTKIPRYLENKRTVAAQIPFKHPLA